MTASHRGNPRQASYPPHSSAPGSAQPCRQPIVRGVLLLRTNQDRWLHILCLMGQHNSKGVLLPWDTSRLAASLLRMNDLIFPMDILPKNFHRLRFARTPHYKHHLRAEDRRLTDELLSWPLEGKLFTADPAI